MFSVTTILAAPSDRRLGRHQQRQEVAGADRRSVGRFGLVPQISVAVRSHQSSSTSTRRERRRRHRRTTSGRQRATRRTSSSSNGSSRGTDGVRAAGPPPQPAPLPRDSFGVADGRRGRGRHAGQPTSRRSSTSIGSQGRAQFGTWLLKHWIQRGPGPPATTGPAGRARNDLPEGDARNASSAIAAQNPVRTPEQQVGSHEIIAVVVGRPSIGCPTTTGRRWSCAWSTRSTPRRRPRCWGWARPRSGSASTAPRDQLEKDVERRDASVMQSALGSSGPAATDRRRGRAPRPGRARKPVSEPISDIMLAVSPDPLG